MGLRPQATASRAQARKKKPRRSLSGALVFSGTRQDQPTVPLASTASSSRATMLVILIIGFTAGPDVSL